MGSLRSGFQPRGHMNGLEALRPHLRDLQHNGKPLDPMPCVLQRDPGQRWGRGMYIFTLYLYQIHIWVVISNIFHFQIFFNYLGKIPIWSGRFTIFDNRLHSCAAIYWDLLPDFEHSDSYFSKGLKPPTRYSKYSYKIWLALRGMS